MIDIVVGLVLDGKRVLFVKEKEFDFLVIPGGRREPGETDLQTLEREIMEELGCKVKNPKLFRSLAAPSVDGNDSVKSQVFLTGLDGTPSACSEIERLVWIDRESFREHRHTPIGKAIIAELISEGLI